MIIKKAYAKGRMWHGVHSFMQPLLQQFLCVALCNDHRKALCKRAHVIWLKHTVNSCNSSFNNFLWLGRSKLSLYNWHNYVHITQEIFYPEIYVMQVLFKASLKIVENSFFISAVKFHMSTTDHQGYNTIRSFFFELDQSASNILYLIVFYYKYFLTRNFKLINTFKLQKVKPTANFIYLN